ncbi:MAG: anaerobic ribonucleoside-triphosphate reductase activating protein [Candidatus Thorarchaeota archaeon]
MKVGGIIDISTKDIPNRSSMVIFTVGCNFKCKFCHNKYLLHPNVGREYAIKELIDKIITNSLVSGVSITGGEPTLQIDLPEVCEQIQKTGKYLSIDTNGSKPHVIENILPYINRVALDLKGSLNKEKLKEITGIDVDIGDIEKTIEILNRSIGVDFEIRTTYVGNLLSDEDLKEIIKYLSQKHFKGTFVLQQYQFLEGVGEEFRRIFSKPEHDLLVNLVKPYKNENLPFKIFLRDEIVGYRNINDI